MPQTVDIGYVGETNFREIQIDMAPWMEEVPGGVPMIIHIRPGEFAEDAYIAATTVNDNVLSWQIQESDLGSSAGEGMMQIWLVKPSEDDTRRGKSVMVKTIVNEAIDNSDTIPEPQEPWMEQMVDLTAQTISAAEETAENAENAAASETAAAASEAAAAASETAAAASATAAAGSAADAATYKNGAISYAQQAASSASTAVSRATAASGSATAAEASATAAAGSATAAANSAMEAAGSETDAALSAAAAAESAADADDAADRAEDARDAAQAAAGDFQGLSASATGLAAGVTPTVNVTHSEGGLYNLAFGIPKGDKGDTGDPAPASAVTPAVDAYLAANFSNPSNPPLDRTLASANSAAPADLVGDLKSAMKFSVVNEQLYGASDALLYGNRNSVTRNGVTFTFNADGSCTVNGTATATSYVDYFASSNSFPDWIIPGVTYDLDYSATNVYFRVVTYTNGVIDNDNLVNRTISGSFVVPGGKSGIIIRLAVPKNRTVNNETVNPHLFVGIKNADIEEELNAAIKVKTGTYTGSSINNIDENSVYICDGNQVTDLPNNTHTFVVETIFTTANKSTGQQTAFDFANGDLYWRKRVGSVWGSWIENNESVMAYKGVLPSGNLNDITYNSIYLLSNGNVYTNSPGTQGTLYTLFISNNIQTQIFIDFNTGKYYYRIKSGSAGTWKNWINANDPYGLSIGTKYVAFGDSLIWGAVWDMDQTTPYYRASAKYQIPTRIANSVGMIDDYENLGIGGAGYYAAPSGNVSVTNAILAYDFTNVELVTIMSGVNDKADSNHPLGSADNPTEGTICGAVKQIIDFFANNYPRVQIVFIQPTPSGHLSDPWAGRLAAGWSLNDFDEEVGKLCHNEHVGYVNWWESVFCKQWDDFSGGYSMNTTSGVLSGPNYSHPTTEKDYAMIGDFIAGKVATLFRGKN